jgi:uncharacterized membrane protein
MTKHNFKQIEVFKEAWSKVKSNAWFLFIVFFLGWFAISAVSRDGLIEVLVGIAVSIAIITASLIIVDGHSPSIQDIFKHFKSCKVPWNYTLSTIIYTLIVLIGFGAAVALLGTLYLATSPTTLGFEPRTYVAVIVACAIILVTLYYAIRLQFYRFLVVDDENLKAIPALKKSFAMTEGNFWSITLFLLSLTVLNIIGAMLFGIGLVITVPVSTIAYALVYRKFTHSS